MPRLDRLLASIDLAQAGALPDGAATPSSIQIESPERIHIFYGTDPAAVRQRAVVNPLTRAVQWFPAQPPLTPPLQDPIPVTTWSADHRLLLETPRGPRELLRSDCPGAEVFLRRDSRAVVYGCGGFTVVDLEGSVLLQDRFDGLQPVPYGFDGGAQRLRLTLRAIRPDGKPAAAVEGIVDYDMAARKRVVAASVHCASDRLCTLALDGTLLATMPSPHVLEIYGDSPDRLTRSTAASGSVAHIRFSVFHDVDPVPGATIRFQNVLRPELDLRYRTDPSGRIAVDTIPNGIYCIAVMVDGGVNDGAPVEILYPRGVNGNSRYRPPGAQPPPQGGQIQRSVCQQVLAGKLPSFSGKTKIDGIVVNMAAAAPKGRRACFQSLLLPDLRFEFEIGADGKFAGELPEGLYHSWLGMTGAQPQYANSVAIAGPAAVVRIGEHAPETEVQIWGELPDHSPATVCLRNETVQKCVDTSRLGQYGVRLPVGAYTASITRDGAVVWTGRLDLSEPGEYRDPIRLPR
jgi:hypothetical protein